MGGNLFGFFWSHTKVQSRPSGSLGISGTMGSPGRRAKGKSIPQKHTLSIGYLHSSVLLLNHPTAQALPKH